MIEIKEGCELSPERETLARISHQQFFRRYLRLSGMTGTAREVASELWSVYRLHPMAIPTRLPAQRRSRGTRLFASSDARWDAVTERVRELQGTGQPVLVGTCSVEASEHLGALLAERGESLVDEPGEGAFRERAEQAIFAEIRETLDRIPIRQLRSSLQERCAQNPNEVRGVVDVPHAGRVGLRIALPRRAPAGRMTGRVVTDAGVPVSTTVPVTPSPSL